MDPCLRPLHDAPVDILGAAPLAAPVAGGAVGILPVAFMRGRTVRDACICVDEAQDLTVAQARMVLARLGESGRAPVPGRLEGRLDGVAVVRLGTPDVVRHPEARALLPLLPVVGREGAG